MLLPLPPSHVFARQALHIAAAGDTHTGRSRSNNEDALAVDPEMGLFAVADGLGGHACGEVASHLAIQELIASLSATSGRMRSLGQRLLRALDEANAAVFAASARDPAMRGMATTIVAALAHQDRVAIAHVGDSRAYLLRDRHLSRLTEDHTVANHYRFTGIDPRTRLNFAHSLHSLTRALGSREAVESDVRLLEPTAGDVLLLCSDGLTNVVGDDEIQKILSTGASPAETAAQLVDAANEQGGPDNITAIVMRYATTASSRTRS